jgi:crotonobetainyl-CoA:carnitine CoA-transferase CaiB-like acyl-CoA transferase
VTDSPTPPGALPLAGIRVLALEQAASGPFATQILGDMGAEVIKVERVGSGDVIRGWDRVVRGLSSGYVWLNRAKRSIAVDLKEPRGREIVDRLVAEADVLLVNLSPGATRRLGLEWETLEARYPTLIYCAISGYGSDGPYADMKAYDLLIQGEAGILATTGYPDAPAKVAVPVADIAAGSTAALAITLALFQRASTGRGQRVDTSMFESLLSWLAYFPHHFWHRGEEPERVGMRHHYMVPYGPYLARDGRYVNIAVASDTNWQLFCQKVLRQPQLADDPSYRDAPSRRQNRARLEATVEHEFQQEDSDEWLARLRAADLPHAELRTIEEVLAHPQVAARNLIRDVDSPVGPVPTIESPIRLSRSSVAHGRIPGLGEDTATILAALGYTAAEVEELAAAGVVDLGGRIADGGTVPDVEIG